MPERREKRPPCVSCFRFEATGPIFEAEWKAVLKRDEDGYVNLYQPDQTQPCAWIHYSCFLDHILKHATRTATGARLKRICMVCGVDLREDELLPLKTSVKADKIFVWVHRECMEDY